MQESSRENSRVGGPGPARSHRLRASLSQGSRHAEPPHARRPLCRSRRLPFRTALRGGSRSGRRHVAHALSGRGAGGRRADPMSARATHLVLPLPQDDSPLRGCGTPGGGAGLHRLRPLGQADAAVRLHLRTPRRVAAGVSWRHRPDGHHTGVPGLGRAHRPARCRRGWRAFCPHRGGEHRAAGCAEGGGRRCGQDQCSDARVPGRPPGAPERRRDGCGDVRGHVRDGLPPLGEVLRRNEHPAGERGRRRHWRERTHGRGSRRL